MILEISVKVPSTPSILSMTEDTFPSIIRNDAGLNNISEVVNWLTKESSVLKLGLSNSGTVLFRGFPIFTPEDFDSFSSAFNYGKFT